MTPAPDSAAALLAAALPPEAIAPGATIGVLGGGQLGRMAALAAARLGYRCHIFCDAADSPAADVAARVTVAAADDPVALARFADAVDVVTLEWENLPVDSLAFLATRVAVRPGPEVLAVTQDRVAEKRFVNALGLATAPWCAATDPAGVLDATAALGLPAIFKTARFGYDGRGQHRLTDGTPAEAARVVAAVDGAAGIVEAVVAFACEASVIVARGLDGAAKAYPVVETIHENHILARTRVPARLPPGVAARAEAAALAIANALGVVGLLAVEMFVTNDGAVLINELAPRPHNSGHWTIDAAATSQFEQLVRAVCGLPLGNTAAIAPAETENLIGDDIAAWPGLLAEPGARVHLYGKREVRPGRKMGHVTRLLPPPNHPWEA